MKDLLKGIICSILLTVVFIIVLSILISTTSLPEKIIIPAIIVISTFSIMIGGFIVSKNKKENGLINGAIVGGINMLCIYILSCFITLDFSITLNSIIMIFAGIIGGMLGGIIGVNF